jgi:DNA-binding phage protein
MNRFGDKHTEHYNYTRLQSASQEKNESPEMFLNRLRKLCQRKIQLSENAVEEAVISREADRRLLAAFINGLIGTSGKHVRLQISGIIDRALNMAIVATNAEREEKALGREERGTSAKVNGCKK